MIRFAFALAVGLAPVSPPALQDAPPRDGPRDVAILLFDGVELLDFAGPGEVFAAARDGGRRAFRAFTVAATREPLRAQGFVQIVPEHDFASCPPPDVLVVPGGSVPDDDPRVVQWVAERARTAEVTLSVCNGALVLAAGGLLDGREAATHASARTALMALAPTARVLENRRFADEGRVVTTAGVSAGIDGALHVVERLVGAEAARATATYMEYAWRPEEIAALHAEPGRAPAGAEQLARLAWLAEAGPSEVAARWRAACPSGVPAEDEALLNAAGYTLLWAGRTERAASVLRLACELFPGSANAHDSLGEMLDAAGDATSALAASRRALELLGAGREGRAARVHTAAASRVARLEGRAADLRFACVPCGRRCDALRWVEGADCPVCSMPLSAVE